MYEKPLVTKMRENYRYFGSLSLIYGFIFSFCLYRNMHGITFPICIVATIAFALLFMKKINYILTSCKINSRHVQTTYYSSSKSSSSQSGYC